MNVYLDLTIINLLLNSLVALYFLRVLTLKKIKVRYWIITSLFNSTQLIFIYQNFYVSYILFILINCLLFYKIYKKNFVFYLFIYLIFSYISQFLILLVFHGLTFYRGVFIISKSAQALSLFSYPLILIIIFCVSLFIDKLYRFRKFKEEVFLIVDNRKFFLNGYMDSGNLLMHKNSPVVFIGKNAIEAIEFDEEIITKTINGNGLTHGKKALISLDGCKTYKYIYLCIDENRTNFNDCDCLLNVNLI